MLTPRVNKDSPRHKIPIVFFIILSSFVYLIHTLFSKMQGGLTVQIPARRNPGRFTEGITMATVPVTLNHGSTMEKWVETVRPASAALICIGFRRATQAQG